MLSGLADGQAERGHHYIGQAIDYRRSAYFECVAREVGGWSVIDSIPATVLGRLKHDALLPAFQNMVFVLYAAQYLTLNKRFG